MSWTRMSAGRLAACGISALLSLAPSLSRAAPTEQEKIAASLFKEAKKLLDKKPADACVKLDESYKLDPAPGTLINLADCYERVGKIASAWERFNEVADVSRKDGNTARERAARARAEALAPKVPKLTLNVPAASKAAGIEVKRNKIVVDQSQWGKALPVDPGVYVVEASAPKRRAWQGFTIVEEGKQTSIDVPPLELQIVEKPPELSKQNAPPPDEPKQPSPTTIALEPPKIPAWVWGLGSFGLASLAVAAGFGVDGIVARTKLETLCPTSFTCPPEYDPGPDNARKNRGLAIFVGAGLAGVAGLGAAVGGLADARSPKAATSIDAKVIVGPLHGGALVVLHGGF